MPVYYELSWSILSTIGLISFLIAVMVSGIVHVTSISMTPIVVSAACAIANGLCYYAFYANYGIEARAVAAGFADMFWFIQEAGLSMYSYQILTKVLQHRPRTVFLTLFWGCILIIFGARIAILVSRVTEIKNSDLNLQSRINQLHIVYFVMIAVVETISAVFLLRVFARAKRASAAVQSWTAKGLFSLLTRSAEIRLATLCPIGITRAITYSFQTTSQSATDIASQLDRFVYTLECLFPMIMIVDVLASKLTYSRGAGTSSDRSRAIQNPLNSGIEVEFSVRTESSKRANNQSNHSHHIGSQSKSKINHGVVRLSSQDEDSEDTIPVVAHGADVGHSANCHV